MLLIALLKFFCRPKEAQKKYYVTHKITVGTICKPWNEVILKTIRQNTSMFLPQWILH